jgi:predicted permease
MTSWLADLRHGFRMIRLRPSLAAAVIFPLALAIAMTSALFSVVDGLLFRPLPFHDAQAIVQIDYRRVGRRPVEVAYLPELADAREALRQRLLASDQIGAVARADPGSLFNLDAARDARIESAVVDASFFALFGLRPAIGRVLNVDDQRVSSPARAASAVPLPVVIGYEMWQSQFGGRSDVLGVHDLAGRRVRIVGVMARGVKFPGETAVWGPVSPEPPRLPRYARLAPGASVDELTTRFPDLEILPLSQALRLGEATAVVILFGSAALFLLVAWVQVAALTISGAAGRAHEVGVRLALGAGRVRLTRQFALEQAVLAGAAFVLAWSLTPILTAFIVGVLPDDLIRGQYLAPDARTFLFGCASTVIGMALLTLLPMGVIRRTAPLRLLRGHVGELPIAAERLRRSLLFGQVSVTAVLLYLSGLTVHSLINATMFDYGFDTERVLLFTPPVPPPPVDADLSKYKGSDPRFEAAYEEKLQRVRVTVESMPSVSGVDAIASFFRVPLLPGIDSSPDPISRLNGRPLAPPLDAYSNTVGPDFVDAVGATLLNGTGFDHPENAGQDGLIIVNETLARILSPSLSVLDQQIQPSVVGMTMASRWIRGRIVGVIKDFVHVSPEVPPIPEYFAVSRTSSAARVLALRLTGPISQSRPRVQAALEKIWGPVSPSRLQLMVDAWHEVLVPFRGQAMLLTLITISALPLAAVGLLGALMYSVRVRARDTAIRLALGADPRQIRTRIVRSAVLLVGVGLAAGVGVGIVAGRVAAHHLLHVSAVDPSSIAGVAAMMLLIAWLAAFLPARSAARTNPADVLRT